MATSKVERFYSMARMMMMMMMMDNDGG